MVFHKVHKQDVIKSFKVNETDTGSSPVQIALLTERINLLTDHFKNHNRDYHSRIGLLRLVSKRRKLLEYMRTNNFDGYQELVKKLNLRK